MVRLMNSAMMPAPGTYVLRRLTQNEFATLVGAAYDAACLVSYIGYQQTADMISELARVPIAVSRDMTPVATGDTLLICKLRYRVADPTRKGEQVPEDFEFFEASYEKEE